MKLPRKRKPPKPAVPGFPPGKWGAYEVRRSLATGCVAMVAGILKLATDDNITALISKPGVAIAGIAAFLSVARFIGLLFTNNTGKKA